MRSRSYTRSRLPCDYSSLWRDSNPVPQPPVHHCLNRSLAFSHIKPIHRLVSLLTGGEWLVALLVSPSERVAVKALRLALALVKTPSNRALVFGDGAPRSCGDAGLTGDMLGAVFHLATQHAGSETLRVLCLRLVHAAVSDVGQPLVRVLSQSERGLDGVSQSEHGLGFPNQSYSSSSIDGIDQREHGLGGLSQWDRGLDGPDTLMELILRDTCPAVQTEAARVLLTLVSKDGAVATGLGDRAAVRAMRPLLSRIWGAAIPRDDPETICDAPKAGDNAPSEIKIQNSYKSEVQDQAAAADSDAESDHGRNLLTDVFGVSATYISPPPDPNPRRRPCSRSCQRRVRTDLESLPSSRWCCG